MWFAPAKLLSKKVWDKVKAADTVAADCFGWFLTRFELTGGIAQDEQLQPATCCKLLETRELRDWLILSGTDWLFLTFKPFSCADSAKISPLRLDPIRDSPILGDTDEEFTGFRSFFCTESAKIAPLRLEPIRDSPILGDTDEEFTGFMSFFCTESAKIAPLRPRGSVSSIWALR